MAAFSTIRGITAGKHGARTLRAGLRSGLWQGMSAGLAVVLAVAALTVPARVSRASGPVDHIKFLNADGSSVVGISFFNGTQTQTFSGVYAGYYHILVNGQPAPNGIGAFCTDVFDDVFTNETWDANRGQTSDPLTGLPAVHYPVGPDNIFAVDYIAQNYTQPPKQGAQTAAQIAIWDLVLGGGVQRTGNGTSIPYHYSWAANIFQVTSGFGNVNDQSHLATIYGIEQTALGVNHASGSIFERRIAGTQSGGHTQAPQDMVFASVPEGRFPLAMLLGLGCAGLVVRRHRAVTRPHASTT